MCLSTGKERAAEDVILDDIDNYKQTLGSMCALAHVLEKHYDAESQIAPVMRPSPRNRAQAADSVTPDMLSQGRSVDLVVEVKRSLPNSESGRNAVLNQIAKYDDDLGGWKRSPQTHSIVLMTHMSKSARWSDFLNETLKRKKASFDRKVSVVEYVRDSERETYFILKKVWGETGNASLDKYLHNAIVVKGEEIIKKMSVVQFCDSKPDVAYTMSILWGQVFPALITKDEHLSTRGKKAIDHVVDLAEIMEKWRKSPGPLSYPPKQAWIAEALNAFVKIKMAERCTGDRFLVHYKFVHDNLVRSFVRKLAKAGWQRTQRRPGDIRDYFQKPSLEKDT